MHLKKKMQNSKITAFFKQVKYISIRKVKTGLSINLRTIEVKGIDVA